MNAEFFFHGTPSAFQEWGTAGDSMMRYYANVSGIAEPIRFSIELGRIGDKYCLYYSYLRYASVFDSTGRPGSYFGITIRLDEEFVRDIEAIYNLCDSVYNNDVVGKVLSVRGEAAHYLVSTFKERESTLQNISERMAAQIGMLPSVRIAPTLLRAQGVPKTAVAAFNIMDAGSAYFWQQLRSAEQVLVSPHYALRDNQIQQLRALVEPEKKRNQELSAKNEDLSGRLSKATTQIQTLQTSVNNLQSEKKQLSQNVTDLSQEVRQLKETLNKNKRGKSIEQAVSQIATPLDELLSNIRTLVPGTGRKENPGREQLSKKTSGFWEWIRLGLLVLTLLLVTGLYFRACTTSEVEQRAQEDKVSIARLEKTVSELKGEIERLNREKSVLQNKISRQETSATTISRHVPDYSKLIINIEPLKNGAKNLKVDSAYVFEIKRGDYPKGGKWIVTTDGKDIPLKDSSYKVPPSSAGKQITIKYVYNGETVKERTIKIDKQ